MDELIEWLERQLEDAKSKSRTYYDRHDDVGCFLEDGRQFALEDVIEYVKEKFGCEQTN